MSEHPTIPELVNVVVRVLLRSPLHRILSRNTMVLTVTGRKTGKVYRVPVSYSTEGTEIVCFTDSPWWKNLRQMSPVLVTIGGRTISGAAYAVTGPTVAEHLTRHLRVVPRDAKYHAVRLGPGNEPNTTDIERAVHTTAMIRVRLADR